VFNSGFLGMLATAGREISEEEGDKPLIPSSTLVAGASAAEGLCGSCC